MTASSSFAQMAIFRYAFWGFWFLLVPALAAAGLVMGLAELDIVGPLDDWARAQTVPAGIVAFTLFEGVLLRFRHQLPFSSRFSEGGRIGLPTDLRRKHEAATHLVEDTQRIIARHEPDIAKRLGAAQLTALRASVDELRNASNASPFDSEHFEKAFEDALEKTSDPLTPWRKGEFREYAESIGVAIVVALLLRAVVVEAFKIPSGSMLPTLQIGDHIFVSKFAYGPKVPLLDQRVLADLPPKRGDVIVFEFPDPDETADRQDYIKRVMAIPGDVLEVEGGHPIINGWRVPNCRVGAYPSGTDGHFGRSEGDLYVEFLEDNAYLALYSRQHDKLRQGPYVVQEGEAWVMGDNRHNSSDSRAWRGRGPRRGRKGAGVPYDNIKGRAMIVWLPPSRMLVNVMGEPSLPKGTHPDVVRGVERCLAQRPPRSETTPPDEKRPNWARHEPRGL